MTILDIRKLSIVKPDTPKRNSASTNNTTMILNNINCSLEAGEIMGIIGPNGAGKSTLLKAIMGDIEYTGEVRTHAFSKDKLRRARQIAVLPQFSLLNFSYRVSEVVQLGRIPHQSGKLIDEQIVDQALELLDISFLKHRLYPQLSGGEKQRVQLARVLAQIWREEDAEGPRLLILDEPTTALDLGHQQELMGIVKQFSTQGVAIMMVLHDINLASRYSDKLLALLCSEQIVCGNVESVVTEENISRLFNIKAKIIRHPSSNTPLVIST